MTSLMEQKLAIITTLYFTTTHTQQTWNTKQMQQQTYIFHKKTLKQRRQPMLK